MRRIGRRPGSVLRYPADLRTCKMTARKAYNSKRDLCQEGNKVAAFSLTPAWIPEARAINLMFLIARIRTMIPALALLACVAVLAQQAFTAGPVPPTFSLPQLRYWPH